MTPHDPHATPEFTAEFWDERYGSADSIWSGNPNIQLVAQVADLAPGRALDAGTGEGADAVWLAERGWDVVGLDISAVALGRARARADALGPAVSGRITLRPTDLLVWEPGDERFDLVSAQFMHLPLAASRRLVRALATAVAPGGTLLYVAHAPSDLHTSAHRPHDPDLFRSAESVLADLDAGLRVDVTESVAREAVDPDGRTITIEDLVVRAVRTG
jgi:SAM-dependent methyltransferase